MGCWYVSIISAGGERTPQEEELEQFSLSTQRTLKWSKSLAGRVSAGLSWTVYIIRPQGRTGQPWGAAQSCDRRLPGSVSEQSRGNIQDLLSIAFYGRVKDNE